MLFRSLPDVDHLLLIDDGSSDATVAAIRAWQQRHADQGVTLLELTRNFGKEAAMLAGLDYANGRCAAAVLIDSDLQHPPERIPAMVQAWRDGALRSWSLDLIQNLPGQTLAGWDAQLDQAIASQAPHLSIYDLSVEPGTVFDRQRSLGLLKLPEDDLAIALMEHTTQRLASEIGRAHV